MDSMNVAGLNSNCLWPPFSKNSVSFTNGVKSVFLGGGRLENLFKKPGEVSNSPVWGSCSGAMTNLGLLLLVWWFVFRGDLVPEKRSHHADGHDKRGSRADTRKVPRFDGSRCRIERDALHVPGTLVKFSEVGGTLSRSKRIRANNVSIA